MIYYYFSEYIYSGVYSTERGNMDGEETDRRSERDADNVIKIANKLVAESAIKEKKDYGGHDDERGKRTKKDPRATHEDEDFDKESLSSCKSDEDYFEYKKRMMKKIKEQEKKMKKKKGKQSAVSNTDDNVTESGSRLQHQYDEKKKSSTSSALGQAEPVQTKGIKRNDSVDVHSSKRRPQKKGRGDGNGSSDGNATADEVSEIESEMATSPGKAESAMKGESSEGQDLADENYDDKYNDTFTDESVKSENENINDDDNDDETKETNTNLKDKDSGPMVLSPVDQESAHNQKKYDKAFVRQTMENNNESKQDIITDGIGNTEGEGKGKRFHMDICPTDSKSRGNGDFESDSKINERHDDIRGYAISEERADVQREKPDRGKKSEEKKIQKGERNVIGVEEPNEQNVGKHKPDLGLKKAPKENEIIFHPMTKTGENKYLKKQTNEVELRKKGHAKNMQDESKRKGRHFKDLSPRTKVIRGNIGDDGSESDEMDDETYSKILLRDGRASVSDTENESDPKRRDYILAESKKELNYKASNQHVTFIENEMYDDGDDDKLNYRVLIDIGHEQEKEKFRRERGRKRKEKEEKRQKRIEDIRGAANSGIIVQCTDAVEIASNEYETSPDDDIEVQTNVQKGVYQHHFQEEPASTATGGNNVQLVQHPETPAFFNDNNKDEDGEKSSLTFKTIYPSDGDEEDDKEKENANPETWYEVPNISTTETRSRQLEIVRTKYVTNENDRYAQHFKAFDESPNVDNDFLKSTNGTVAILCSHGDVPLETEGNKEVLHISVRSKNPRQNSLTWENEDKPNEKNNSGSESDVSVHNQSNEGNMLSKDKLAIHKDDANERKSSASSVEMDVVSSTMLRDLWLGSRRVSITKNNDEKIRDGQIQLNIETMSQSEMVTDLAKPEIEVSNALNNDCAQDPLSKKEQKEDITAVNIRDMWLGIGKQNDVATTKQTMDGDAGASPRSSTESSKKPKIMLTSGSFVSEDNSLNDASYSDDFSETVYAENDESAKTNFQTQKTDEDYEKLNKSFRNEDGKKEFISENENEGVIKMNIHGLKEDESSSEDVHGIDALIEVLENQLESSKKVDDMTTSNQCSEKNTSTNVDFKSGPSTSGEPENASPLHQMDCQFTINESNDIQLNGFGPDSSFSNKYNVSEDGDISSEEFDLQAKNYVNDILASISVVGFDDVKFQNPTPKAPTNLVDITGANVPLQTVDEENVKSEKSMTHELKRQSPVNNDNADDLNYEHRTEESNRNDEKMSINIPDISNFEPHYALSPTPKNSSLVDPNSPHAEKRRQQRLSVSFAISEEDGVKERDVLETEKLWEEADDFEKEDEYERLERQIERTLCK